MYQSQRNLAVSFLFEVLCKLLSIYRVNYIIRDSNLTNGWVIPTKMHFYGIRWKINHFPVSTKIIDCLTFSAQNYTIPNIQ